MKLLVLFLCVGLSWGHSLVKRQTSLDDLIDEALDEEPRVVGESEPGAGPPVVEETSEDGIEKRTGYRPPIPPPLPDCGVEYDCIEDCHCNEYNEIEVDLSGACGLDLRQNDGGQQKGTNETLMERSGGVYAGANSFIPDKTCYNPNAIYPETRCCRMRPVQECPPNEYCVEGWHCPNHDGTHYFDLRQVPRTCSKYGNRPGVCCAPLSLYPPVPLTCGVRNPDGVQPSLPLDDSQLYQDLNLRQGYGIPKTKTQTFFGEFPWQGLLYKKGANGYQYLAGGVLVTNRHILTVAHHVDGVKAYDLQVRLGEYEVNTLHEPLVHQDYYVERVDIHPAYNRRSKHNDIAILTLNQDVYITNNVHTACLPAEGYTNFDDYRCIATGWGKDTFEGNYQQVLQKVDLPMVNHHKCEAAFQTTRLSKYFVLDKSFICAGGEAGKDTCTGDGGGPLVCQVEGHYVVVGLTAWGIGCANEGIPGAYASVSDALPWIYTVLSQTRHKIFPRYQQDVAPGFRANDGVGFGASVDVAAEAVPLEAQGQAGVEVVPETDASGLTSEDFLAAIGGGEGAPL